MKLYGAIEVNGRTSFPVTQTDFDAAEAALWERVALDADNVPAAAGELAAISGETTHTRQQIIDRLMEHAPKVTKDEARRIRRKARKRIDKVRDGNLRGYVKGRPDELSRRAVEEDMVEAELAKRRARRSADEREAEEAGHDVDAYADGAAIVARIIENGGAQTRQPDAGGVRNDGVRLGYRGKTHAIVGAPEGGKTLATIAMACDEMRAGGSVLHLDTDDNSEDDTFALYLAFGIESEVLGDPTRFRYSAVRTAEGARRFVADAAEWKPTMAILDAVAPFLALFGFDPNSNAEYRAWHAEVPARLSAIGASVWQIDHVNRTDGDTFRYAGGAGQKLGAISGVQYGVTVVEPFVPGQGGASALKILKDRPGGVRAASPTGKTPTAAVFRLDSRGGSSTWEFWRGRDASEGADEQLEADVAFVLTLDPFPASRTKLQATLKATQGQGWATDRARVALEAARQRRDSLTTFALDTTQED